MINSDQRPFFVTMGGWWRWAVVSADGVAPSRMVNVSASVNLPFHHKVQKFSSGTSSPEWSWKKGRKTVVVVYTNYKSAFYPSYGWKEPKLPNTNYKLFVVINHISSPSQLISRYALTHRATTAGL